MKRMHSRFMLNQLKAPLKMYAIKMTSYALQNSYALGSIELYILNDFLAKLDQLHEKTEKTVLIVAYVLIRRIMVDRWFVSHL